MSTVVAKKLSKRDMPKRDMPSITKREKLDYYKSKILHVHQLQPNSTSYSYTLCHTISLHLYENMGKGKSAIDQYFCRFPTLFSGL